MWVPACLVYLSVLLATLARWYRTPEQEEICAIASHCPLAATIEGHKETALKVAWVRPELRGRDFICHADAAAAVFGGFYGK